MKRKVLVFLGIVGLFPIATLAGPPDADMDRFYGGAAIGTNKFEIDLVGFSASETAIKWFMGTQLNDYFGIEGAFIYGGRVKDTISGVNIGLRTKAFEGSLVGSLPINESFSVFAKAGALMWDVEASSGGLVASDDGNDFAYGAGAKLTLGKWQMRLEYQTAEIEDTDMQLITLGLVAPF